jgi:hypothetical protein
MPPRIRQDEGIASLAQRASEGAELSAIGEQVMQAQYDRAVTLAQRLVAEAVRSPRREPG